MSGKQKSPQELEQAFERETLIAQAETFGVRPEIMAGALHVPYDGVEAELHTGEILLTRAQAGKLLGDFLTREVQR